jgi:hypothetical protein
LSCGRIKWRRRSLRPCRSGGHTSDIRRCRHSQYRQRVDPISALDWLLNRGVSAFIRVDPGRDGRRPWTFFASDGPLKDQPIRVDADSPEDCIRLARRQLAEHGLKLPE